MTRIIQAITLTILINAQAMAQSPPQTATDVQKGKGLDVTAALCGKPCALGRLGTATGEAVILYRSCVAMNMCPTVGPAEAYRPPTNNDRCPGCT